MSQTDNSRIPTVLVLGDINVDVLGRLEAPLRTGGDCLAPGLEIHLGGVGANTTLALARWGVPARLLGSAGRDWFGDLALRILQKEDVDTSCVQRTERAPTGLVFIAVEPDGQRTIFGSRGANAEVTLPPNALDYWDGVVAVHLTGYAFLSPSGEQAARRLLAEARARGLPSSLDLGSAPSRQAAHAVLQAVDGLDILIAAGDEAADLTGRRDPRRAIEVLEQRGARQVAVKLGPKGCWFRERGELQNAPAFPVEAVDTTGAGDVFTAALLRARLQGWPWSEAAVFANAAGALAAAVVGAGERAPELDAIARLLEANRLPREWDSVRVRVLERMTAARV
jgi:ribokinase